MNRYALSLVALVLLAGLAGCSAIMGPGQQAGNGADANATYDWDTDANATIELNGSTFTGVYAVENRSSFEVFQRDGLGQESGLDLSAVQFRYPNDTSLSVREDQLAVERGGGRTTITLPNNTTGQVAFTAPRTGKSFGLPTFVQGPYEVTLPGGARVGIPLLGQVSPGGFTPSVGDDGHMTLRWEAVQSQQFQIAWYLQRDVFIFGGLVAIGIVLAVGGTAYYYRQIKHLEAKRKDVGIDVDYDDDDPRDRGPPPGM